MNYSHFQNVVQYKSLEYCYPRTILTFFFFIILFMYLFLAVLGLHCLMDPSLSIPAASEDALFSCGVWASHCSGSPVVEHRFQVAQMSTVAVYGLSSCGSRALEHRLRSCWAQVLLFRGMWDLPGMGIKPVYAPLAGRFFTTEPPVKPQFLFSYIKKILTSS